MAHQEMPLTTFILKQGYEPPRPFESTAHVSFDLVVDRDGDAGPGIDNLLWMAGAVTNNALTIAAVQRRGGVTLAARYSADWFSHGRVEDMLGQWRELLRRAAAAPAAP